MSGGRLFRDHALVGKQGQAFASVALTFDLLQPGDAIVAGRQTAALAALALGADKFTAPWPEQCRDPGEAGLDMSESVHGCLL